MNEKNVWKRRTPARIYDYNYKVGEGYYQPQRQYMDDRDNRSKLSPPKHQTYAERFAKKPWYGQAYGLPYESSRSVYNEPVAKASHSPRSSSLVREIHDLEKEDIPLHIRASRRKKKFENEESNMGIRPKFGRQLSLTDMLPPKSSSARMEELHQDIESISKGFDVERKRPSFDHLNQSYPAVSLKKFELKSSYGPGSSIQKSSNYELKSSSYSRPPIVPRTRKISYGEESSTTRRANPSIYTGRPRSASISGDEPFIQLNRAQKIRDAKRVKESEEFSQNISNMIDKMRQGNIDPESAYRYTRSNKLSSYDPPTRRGSQKRPHGFSLSKFNN